MGTLSLITVFAGYRANVEKNQKLKSTSNFFKGLKGTTYVSRKSSEQAEANACSLMFFLMRGGGANLHWQKKSNLLPRQVTSAKRRRDPQRITRSGSRISLRFDIRRPLVTRWGRFARNVPCGDERGETDVFAGYVMTNLDFTRSRILIYPMDSHTSLFTIYYMLIPSHPLLSWLLYKPHEQAGILMN